MSKERTWVFFFWMATPWAEPVSKTDSAARFVGLDAPIKFEPWRPQGPAFTGFSESFCPARHLSGRWGDANPGTLPSSKIPA